MKDFLKKNWVLVLAFALPVLLIAGVALSAYLPSLRLTTKFDFVYVSCVDGSRNYYQCDLWLQKRYSVVDGKIALKEVDPALDSDKNGVPDAKENYVARVFYHDTLADVTREISLEEAQKLQLDGLVTSPDGVSVSGEYRGGGDFFPFSGRGSSYGYYLTKGNAHRRLNIINSDQYYYNGNFQFVGWVLPGRD